jgi:hypothetical protein
MKLDGKFFGTIVKAKDNSIVPDDEYVVFLAKDTAFAAILPLYRDKCIELRCDTEQVQAVNRLMDRVNAWREANQHRLKRPDAANEKLLD